jgi:hypothetical protein
MRARLLPIVTVALLLIPGGAAVAQSTATAVFEAPYRAFTNYELGGYATWPSDVNWALQGFYRWGWKKNDIGIIGGAVDVAGGTRGTLGADFRARVITHSNSFPLDGALTLGFGSNFGDGGSAQFFLPVGLSVGRRVLLEGSNISFVPYAQPVLTPTFGDNGDLLFTLGLGVDVQISKAVDLRLTAGVGDLDGIGFGVAWTR